MKSRFLFSAGSLRAVVLFSTCLTLLAMGCKPAKPPLVPMGESAPAFGSAGKAALKDFVVGRWCMNSPMSGADPSHYYEFKSDGTFECGGNNKEWTSTGKWVVDGQAVNLTYSTMNGKSLPDFQAEYKKAEEGGTQMAIARAFVFDQAYDQIQKLTQLWVDSDTKHLTSSQPQQQAPTGGGDESAALSDLMAKVGGQLERMGPKKE